MNQKNIVFENNGELISKDTEKSIDDIFLVCSDLKNFGIKKIYVFESVKNSIPICSELNLETMETIKINKFYVPKDPTKELLALLIGWGNLYYLNYWETKLKNSNKLLISEKDINDIIRYFNNSDDEEVTDIIDWINDKNLIGRKYFDNVMNNFSVATKYPMKVYRTFDWSNDDKNQNGYVSVSESTGKYNDSELREFTLPVGTMVVPTKYGGKNYCDNDELLINIAVLRNCQYKIID